MVNESNVARQLSTASGLLTPQSIFL